MSYAGRFLYAFESIVFNQKTVPIFLHFAIEEKTVAFYFCIRLCEICSSVPIHRPIYFMTQAFYNLATGRKVRQRKALTIATLFIFRR